MRNLRQRLPLWALWLMGAITFFALALLVLAVVLGVRAGQQQLAIKQRQQVSAALQQALEYHNSGNMGAARLAYEEVLMIDPDNNAAVEGLNHIRQMEAMGIQGLAPTPSPGPTANTALTNTGLFTGASPGNTPPAVAQAVITTAVAATVAPAPSDTQALLAQAEVAFNAGRWTEAIDGLKRLRAANADYAAAQVDELLFEAYVNLATERDNQNKLEEALALFDQALALRPEDAATQIERELVANYIDALTYTGADWARTRAVLQEIYAVEPNYRDVQSRLQEALSKESEIAVAAEAWCDAAQLLTDAIDLAVTPGIIARRDQYQSRCDQGENVATAGTPTAGTPTEGTPAAATTTTPATVAEVPAEAPSVGALGSGAILYSAADPNSGRSQILAQGVDGSPATLFRDDAAQGALRNDGQRLIYRNTRNDLAGLSAWDPATGLFLRFTQYAEDSLPSWNPAGNRLAFASNREGDRIWRVYLTWAEEGAEVTSLTIGEAPQWHPTEDRIAFRGCDDTGNRCGLWQVNSRGGDRAPLTTVPSDNRPTWSPDGRYVVFTSDGRDGNFDLYRVDVSSGQVVPLTVDPAIDTLPTVSPDGRWVGYASTRGGNWQLWAVSINGGTPVLISPINGDFRNWTEQSLQWVP